MAFNQNWHPITSSANPNPQGHQIFNIFNASDSTDINNNDQVDNSSSANIIIPTAASLTPLNQLTSRNISPVKRYSEVLDKNLQSDDANIGNDENDIVRTNFPRKGGFHTYTLIDPTNINRNSPFRKIVKGIFYIGKGKKKRRFQHFKECLKRKGSCRRNGKPEHITPYFQQLSFPAPKMFIKKHFRQMQKFWN